MNKITELEDKQRTLSAELRRLATAEQSAKKRGATHLAKLLHEQRTRKTQMLRTCANEIQRRATDKPGRIWPPMIRRGF